MLERPSPGSMLLAALAIAACGGGARDVAPASPVGAPPDPSTATATSTHESTDVAAPVERVLDLGQPLQGTAAPVVPPPAPRVASTTVSSFGQPLPVGHPMSLALGAIASTLDSCKRPRGPTGSGRARILFQPDGTVSAVEFVWGSFAGTDVGGCILRKLRGARVSPFTGSAVPVELVFVL